MFTTTLAEVISVKGRTLTVQPLFKPDGVPMPPITGVQMGLFGNAEQFIDVHIKPKTSEQPGDVVLILFTTFDISNYVTFGNKDIMDTNRRNDFNSCIALPFTFTKHLSAVNNPTGGIHMKGYMLEQGQKRHEGDLDQQGQIESTGDHIAGGVSLINHTHTYKEPEHVKNPVANTGKPVVGG